MTKLDDARKDINEIDAQMAELFEKRMQAVEKVIAYKQEQGLPVLDRSRENFVIAHNLQYIKEEKYQDSYKEFLQDIMAISRKYQKTILNQDVVGYQGVEGAFSHIACTHVFRNIKSNGMHLLKMCLRPLWMERSVMVSYRLKTAIPEK